MGQKLGPNSEYSEIDRNGGPMGGVTTNELPVDEDMDVATIKAVQRGERHRFAEIVDRHKKRAYHIAYSFVNNNDDAMDLAQESFLKSFRAIKTFDTTQRFFPWFYKILRNTCLSHIKRRKLRRKFSLTSTQEDETDLDPPDLTLEPTSSVIRDELRAKFWIAFKKLKVSDREILGLRHFEDMSYEDIAKTLEIPIGTVMSRLFHARRKLKERMEPHI